VNKGIASDRQEASCASCAFVTSGRTGKRALAHDLEKCEAVFRKDHAQPAS
jgi:hypothetical protein